MDEAFLTEILADPANTTIRREYAKLLRSVDPLRSEYLNLEISWTLSRTACALSAVESCAATLDPIWVARISRPPVGVCSTHILLQHGDCGRERLKVTAEHLVWLESRFNVTLPLDYRAFLLNYNGGSPDPNVLRICLDQERAGCNRWVNYFCSIWAAKESEIDWDIDLVWRLQQLEHDIRHEEATDADLSRLRPWEQEMARRWRSAPHVNWMIIGAGAPTGELEWFCLECRGPHLGRVYCVDSLAEFPDGPDYCLVAPSFREFLAMIGAP